MDDSVRWNLLWATNWHLDRVLLDERNLSYPFYRVGIKKTTPVYGVSRTLSRSPKGLGKCLTT